MKNKVRNMSIVFGALFAVSVILALVFSPLRGTYFNHTNFLYKAVSMSGINNGKIKNARALTSSISEPTSLNIPTISNSGRKGYFAKRSTTGNRNHLSNLQINYNVVDAQSNFIGEPGTNSGNRNEKVSSVSQPQSNFIASSSVTKKSASTNISSSNAGYATSTTDLTIIQPKSGAKFNAGGAGGPPPDSGGDTPPVPGPVPSLPIGNGVHLMLFMAIALGAWKARKLS